ncbi:flagellar assembly protein FliH [Shewanella sp. Isolate11]|uniref:flagellar assembly protein FliH n=1 Tax=Shewanella sp. Isolate11 TaxID=2908530 RepID=UPI001EFC957C|nr:flagellar assembly protein FliH [Shewanella sp. Isolate11]MCG9697150.1 flagellar assembly protein FliH [Shewanella sp. Isolate11]
MTDPKNPNSAKDSDFNHWHLPDMTVVDEVPKENMFGRVTVEQAIVEEDLSILPPTLEEIETIRAEAEAEGFDQGQQQGHQQGLESGRLEGLEQGHQEGYAQGLEQGIAQGLADAAEQVQQFEKLMQQLASPLSLLDIEIEQSLLHLTLTLTKAVIGHELKTHPEHILSALRQGVEALPLKEQGVHVRLQPDDLCLVERLYGSQQLEKNRWEMEADPLLQRGECVVSNSRSTVDMGLEKRINAVFTHLVNSENHLEQQKQLELQKLQDKQKALAEIAAEAKAAEAAVEALAEQQQSHESQTQQASSLTTNDSIEPSSPEHSLTEASSEEPPHAAPSSTTAQ